MDVVQLKMPRAYQRRTLGPNESTKDFVDRLFKDIKDMPQDSLRHRPLPQNPKILTLKGDSSLQHNTELWKETCPVCRPIVRDLKVFCVPHDDEQSIFQDQNIFICWNVVFSSMASAIVTGEASAQNLDSTGDFPERHDQNEGARGNDGTVDTEELQTKQGESSSGASGEEAWDTETGNGKVIGKAAFCEFCAYFACSMFDDSMYHFSTSADGTGNFEVNDCCCMQSMTDSKKVKEIAKKFIEYAEKFGQHAQIQFVIQPIDCDLKQQHFGRLRFQAYSRSPTISDQDLENILGLGRELVLEVYGIPGRLHSVVLGFNSFFFQTCSNILYKRTIVRRPSVNSSLARVNKSRTLGRSRKSMAVNMYFESRRLSSTDRRTPTFKSHRDPG